jgi:hypothetical protein
MPELYKLKMTLQLLRYRPEEDKPRQPSIAEAARNASQAADPVERDEKHVSGEAIGGMLDAYVKGLNAPQVPPEMPEAAVSFGRTYDVQVDSLAAAAALCKKFEDVAEAIGVPAAEPADPLNLVQMPFSTWNPRIR